VAPGTKAFARASEAWRSDTLDGEVFAEPLVVGGQVLVATENNTIYSFDARTGQVSWSAHLGEPIQRSQLPCGDINVTGITSTPVVDVAKGVLYAVTFVQPGRHELVALDLATGAVRFRQANDPPGADPLTQQQRSALVLAVGQVYVAYGGLFGDCGAYHGWVVAASAADGSQRSTYQVPTQREGGIWAPSGPAVDAAGNVYVATGNGSSTNAATFDFGDAVLRLSPDLHLLDWFAPAEWVQLNGSDADIGSLGPALLDGGLLFQIGKSGVGYLLRTDQLGHEAGQAFSASVCRSAFGGTAYAASVIYVPCSDGLVALQVDNKPAFSVLWRLPGLFAGPPIVADGAVWTIGRDGTLDAVDPRSGQTRFHASIGTSAHFATPSASDGRLFVPAAKQILAFTLE
jgi:outer membrane protein assembly factor BamB